MNDERDIQVADGPRGDNDPLARVAELPGVRESVEEARAAVDRMYRHRILRRRGPEVSAESALRGARASAALEGAEFPLEQVRSGSVGDPIVQGALRASAEVGRAGSTWRTAPRQVLARLHSLAAAGSAPDDCLGRPRSTASVADPWGVGPAPSPPEVSVRLDALADLLSGSTKTPALLLAAVVHAELVVLRPFGTADAMVARAAERLTLVERGLDPKSLVAVEVGHLALRATYSDALVGYLSGTASGLSLWVRHCADAVIVGARETLAICEALQRG
ncbi:oxidoreductase [Rhizohabitans arisaemae]|uniref:oxidoreductase n=1 Tax=Rhizohabitans arisaemae TaxID=2720610 RepID=UPI0024B16D8F|nr:oxidoreductase [Rhizohabitans arisaemae]